MYLTEKQGAFGWQALPARWQALSGSKKLAALVLAAALLMTLFFLGQVIARPRMASLFTGLEPAEAGRIVEKLKELAVPYSLADEGRTILVPAGQVYDMRIQLAGAGTLVGGAAGFELFDQTRLGATDFNRRLDFQRALQEELRRTIVQLDEVEQARVHLALPEPSVFVRETAAPSASIVLKLRPFSELGQEQVRGIVFLVAGSVEGLLPENITLIDTRGNILNAELVAANPAGQAAEASLRQLEVRRGFERELEQRVQRMLERVHGPGQALVMVTAEMDFDSRETTTVTFADEGVPRSRTVVEESFQGTGALPAEAGTAANIPGYVFAGAGGESEYTRSDETVNYEVDETRARVLTAPGRLVRLHTAVVLNDREGGLTEAQLQQSRDAVAAALGFQEERGDSINVQGMNFETGYLEEARAAMEKAAQAEERRQYITYGALFLAGLIVLFVLLRAFRRWREDKLERELAALQVAVPAQPTVAEGELLQAGEQRLHQRVRHLAEKEPDMTAHLIRTWLVEE
jgi:flagellar M-ring protein FliF